MIITGKRRRKLDKMLTKFEEGTKFIPGLIIDDSLRDILLKMGFTENLHEGETILPSSDFGPVCKFNAEGKYIIHKDQPMETAYRQVEWTWKQWAGYWGTETHSKIVDVPYQRYPRTPVPPPSIELSIVQNIAGQKYIVAPCYELKPKNHKSLLHAINIFLEIFGQCEVLSEDLSNYALKNVKRLNWKILPPGKWPWKKLENNLSPFFKKISQQIQVVIKYRLEIITSFNPEFVAVGQAGFFGYFIFGFPRKNLYVLESLYNGNATYVFEEAWEELSKLTKAAILQGRLHKERIIHREQWESHVKKLLK